MRTRVARHASSLGSWEMVSREPHAALRPHVVGYCGYTERTVAPLRRRESASTHVTLIISFGPSIDVLDDTGRARPHVSFVAGPDDSWAVTEHAGLQAGVDVKLSPLGASTILGVPTGQLARQVVELDAVLGRVADTLTDQLAEAPDWTGRFAALDAFLGRRLAAGRRPPATVTRAWERLEETHGRLRMDALARELGCSPRFLTSRFAETVGLAPKTAARVLRFRRAVGLLGHDDGTGLAEVAARCGYADQSHLSRDVRAFAGCAPAALLRHRLPDGGGLADAGAAVPKRPRRARTAALG